MAAAPSLRTSSKTLCQLIANWLALLVLLLLGVVWPPVFASDLTHPIQPGGPLRFVVTADFSAGAGNVPPRPSARAAALLIHAPARIIHERIALPW